MFRSFQQPYGLQLLLPTWVNTLLMAIAVALTPRSTRRWPVERALLAGVLAWLLFAPGIATNYFPLLIAVAILNARQDRRWLWPVSILAALIEAEFCGLIALSAAARAGCWIGLFFLLFAWFIELIFLKHDNQL